MALQEVAYRCIGCSGISRFKFPETYRPFRRWQLTCRRCRTYRVHVVLKRPMTGDYR